MRFRAALYACVLLVTVDTAASNLIPIGDFGNRWVTAQIQREKNCRAKPHYICNNGQCVTEVNARCDGIEQCKDKSDEINCNVPISPTTRPSSTVHYVATAPRIEPTTPRSSFTCVIPEQPRGGRFVRGSCEGPCNMAPGSRVPTGSFLTYRCNEGHSIIGDSISVCDRGTWSQPPACVKTCPLLESESVKFSCKYQGDFVSCRSAIFPGTIATLSCKDSYKIPIGTDPGFRELTCLEEGEWNLFVFQCIPECGKVSGQVNPLIINGSPAKHGEFPWHVGIYLRDSSGNFDQICGGVLVSPNLVISAAHCFYDEILRTVMETHRFAVAAGKYYRSYNIPLVDSYAQKSQVKKIDVAERFFGRSGNYAHDIALVRLETRFTMTALVRPICMDWDNSFEGQQLRNGTSGKVVGWGITSEGVPSDILHEITLPYIPYEQCIAEVPEDFKGFVTADKFCAGHLNGSSLCNGDSGGGLCFQFYELWYLRGIVSVGPSSQGMCDNNYYAAFTYVSSHLEWIRAAFRSAE